MCIKHTSTGQKSHSAIPNDIATQRLVITHGTQVVTAWKKKKNTFKSCGDIATHHIIQLHSKLVSKTHTHTCTHPPTRNSVHGS